MTVPSSSHPHIVSIVSTLSRSGPIAVLLNILKYLDRQAFTPHIITLSPEPANTLLPVFTEMGVAVHPLNLSRVEGIALGAARLRALLAPFRPALVHTHGLRADLLAAYRLRDYPRVSTLHNYPFVDYRMTYGAVVGSVMARAQVVAAKRTTAPVSCSQSVADMMLPHGVRCHAIANGVDDALFFPASPVTRTALREKLDLPHDHPVLISVGHLSSRKDPETLIRGFLASAFRERALLLFLGDGPLRGACEQLAQHAPQIRFVGKVSNVVDYLQAADLFLSASHAEGLPNAVMEALACGLPVCLSAIPPHTEILTAKYPVGFSFPVGDSAAAARCLEQALDADLPALSLHAAALIHEVLSARKMSEAYQRLYGRLLQEAQNRAPRALSSTMRL